MVRGGGGETPSSGAAGVVGARVNPRGPPSVRGGLAPCGGGVAACVVVGTNPTISA